MKRVMIDVKELYSGGHAKLADIPRYLSVVREKVGHGDEVVLTGQGPIWLYLLVAHELHGRVTRLVYNSPVTRDVVIFDHNPF